MSIKFPSIDVIIPVYNGEKYIKRAISSVLNQTYLPTRLIIIDDGSTDKTLQIIEKIKSDLDKGGGLEIKLLHSNHLGPSAARNIGLKESVTDYVAFLDADDQWDENKLSDQVEVFRKDNNKKVGLVYCKFNILDHTNNNKYRVVFPKENNFIRGFVFDKIIPNHTSIRSPSLILVRRDAIDTIGYFDQNLICAEDLDFIMRIAQKYQFDFVPKYLVTINSEPNSLSKQNSKMIKGLLFFYKKWRIKLSYDHKKLIALEILNEFFNYSIFPPKAVHRKSLIGKMAKELARPFFIDLILFFI